MIIKEYWVIVQARKKDLQFYILFTKLSILALPSKSKLVFSLKLNLNLLKICLILAYFELKTVFKKLEDTLFFHPFKNRRTKVNNKIKGAERRWFFPFFFAKKSLKLHNFMSCPNQRSKKIIKWKLAKADAIKWSWKKPLIFLLPFNSDFIARLDWC